MKTDFQKARAWFPMLADKTYLNSGSYGALAMSVRDAFARYLDDRILVGANWDVWVMKNEAVRRAIAGILRANSDEIAVTASTSAGINSIASALDFSGQRNKVVVSDFEFPTNAQIWHAQERRGARIVHVPADAGGYIPPERFADQIDDETLLVAFTHVCFRNGARLDAAEIARLAHAQGAYALLDVFQSVGTMTVDVKAIGVDFAVGGVYKYLLGTSGVAFLYVREALIPSLTPTSSGWFAQADIPAMDVTANNPSPTARRFEGGSPPVANCYAAEAGLNIISRIGTDAIGEQIQGLTANCAERLEEIGWTIVTPKENERRGAMLAILSSDSGGLCGELANRQIYTSHRDSNLRAAFHFYNNSDDIEMFVSAMEELRPRFAAARR